jgi:rare lipoprotein A
MHTILLILVLVGLMLAGGCVEAHGRSSRMGQPGWASWYGKFHHGRRTASGKRFSMYRLTAAHRTLPLGTTVIVTNLRTQQQVVVRITDRGPYVDPKRRIIDLSRAAARRIGLEKPGLGPVRVVTKRSPRRPTVVAAARPTSAQRPPLRLVGREQARRPPARTRVVSVESLR